jgi:hypothetical protein
MDMHRERAVNSTGLRLSAADNLLSACIILAWRAASSCRRPESGMISAMNDDESGFGLWLVGRIAEAVRRNRP